MKINNKNYLIYLVVFVIILFIFYYIFSDKNALIQQLYHEFGKIPQPTNIKEGLTTGGLDWTIYRGYFNDNLDFKSKFPVWMSGSGATNLNLNLSSLNSITNNQLQENRGDHQFTIELKGYFLPNVTGYWHFRTTSDDASYLWIENDIDNSAGIYSNNKWNMMIKNRIKNWDRSNVKVDNRGLHPSQLRQSSLVHLTAGRYYAILVYMGENYGRYNLSVEWLPPNGKAWSSNGIGLLYPSNINPSVGSRTPGLLWTIYQNYFNDDVTFPSKYPILATGIATNTSNLSMITSNQYIENVSFLDPDGYPVRGMRNLSGIKEAHNFSMEMQGYFRANMDGEWEFFTYSDDASYVWLDDKLIINNGGLHSMRPGFGKMRLKAGNYYPIRIQFGENQGLYAFRFGWKPPGGTWTCNGDGYFFNSPGGTLAESQNDHKYFVYK